MEADLHSLGNAPVRIEARQHSKVHPLLSSPLRGASKAWHGVKLHRRDWSQQSHSLAFSAVVPEEDLSFYIIFNAYWEPLEFQLPAERHIAGQPWRRWIETSLESPDDIQDWPAPPVVTGPTYLAGPRSVVVLIAAADKTARVSVS